MYRIGVMLSMLYFNPSQRRLGLAVLGTNCCRESMVYSLPPRQPVDRLFSYSILFYILLTDKNKNLSSPPVEEIELKLTCLLYRGNKMLLHFNTLCHVLFNKVSSKKTQGLKLLLIRKELSNLQKVQYPLLIAIL